MLRTLRQIWQSDDLRKRILFSIAILCVYRILAHVPVPGADSFALRQFLDSNGLGGVLGVFAALTGGGLDTFSIVMLGLGPYINASIIMQLSTVIFPKLEALSKEGVQGQQQINKYTRYLSIPMAFLQSYGFLILLSQSNIQIVDTAFPGVLLPMLYVTMGSVLLMWLGEIMTEKGISNGISLIIFVGIISSIPTSLQAMLVGGQTAAGSTLFFALISLAMLVAVVVVTDAHRFLPITYANQGAGRGVQGGIPIRLNQAGMIPILFAISLVTLPAILAQFLATAPRFQEVVNFINLNLNAQNPSLIYITVYFLLVVAFSFFYVSVTFKPKDLAENIQKRGGFIPGIRPGQQTEQMLERTSLRLNLWGGVFLGLIAVVPLLFTRFSTLGTSDLIVSGSGLIIVVGVVMELIRQTNSQLLSHDYQQLRSR